MKIKPYFDKLSASKEYKKFQKDYSDAFMIAGFFILDFESGKSLHQIDYYVPSEKKIAAFTLDKGVMMQMLEMMHTKIIPEKLDLNTNVDLDALRGILEDEMKNRSITEEIKKIIAILQTIDGKKIWNLNCVLSGMSILKAHIDDDSQTVLKLEKASIMDYVKKMPGGMPGGIPGKMNEAMPSEEEAVEEESEKELKEKIKGLKNLEKDLVGEEQKYEEELKKRQGKEKKQKKKTD